MCTFVTNLHAIKQTWQVLENKVKKWPKDLTEDEDASNYLIRGGKRGEKAKKYPVY